MPNPSSTIIYPHQDASLKPLYLGFLKILRVFRARKSPKILPAILSIEKLFEEWEKGIDISLPSQPTLDETIECLLQVPNDYLIDVVDELEAIQRLKHLIINHPAS